jgi:hypothetical protein
MADFVSYRPRKRFECPVDLTPNQAIVLIALVTVTRPRGITNEIGITDVTHKEYVDAVVGYRPFIGQIIRFTLASQVVSTIGIGRTDPVMFDPADTKAGWR